jgi:hypothetical protein
MKNNSSQISDILSRGHFLGDIGINGWALNKEEAEIALLEFEKMQIPILGGDVYEMKNSIISHNYDNWYYERKEDESFAEFVSNSIEKATEYIRNYYRNCDPNIFFVLVPRTQR